MALSTKQQGVAKDMGLALILSLASISYAIYSNPMSFDDHTDRLKVLSYSLTLTVLALFISIGRLAKHRFLAKKILMVAGSLMAHKKHESYKASYKTPLNSLP